MKRSGRGFSIRVFILPLFVLLFILSLRTTGLLEHLFASGSTLPTRSLQSDLDGDGSIESYLLSDGTFTISENGQQKWHSPSHWQVQWFTLGDIRNCQQDEILLVVWKQGSFGRNRPFWLKADSHKNSSHLFIYSYRQDLPRPVWMSSALDKPIKECSVVDINHDGLKDLAVKEGEYTQRSFPGTVTTQETTFWQWQQWGFYRIM